MKEENHTQSLGIKLSGRPLPSVFEAFGSITSTVEEIVVMALSASTHHPAPQKNGRKRKREKKGGQPGIGPHQHQTAARSLHLARLSDL